MKEILMTVSQYAKHVGKSRNQIYMDIRLGKINNFVRKPAKEQLLIRVKK